MHMPSAFPILFGIIHVPFDSFISQNEGNAEDGAISEEKLVWIEAFHTQWIGKGLGRYYTQIYNDGLGRDIIINIARSFRTNGPHRIVDIRVKNKIALTMHDREILLKLCFLLATLDGPMSTNETWLVIEIASAVDISEKRLLKF